MKIRLKNFRCYAEKEFVLQEKGLTLISGSSGSGKSTIIYAILFALFGIGTKLQTSGSKSCEVHIEFSERLKVTRKKCPNHLVVEVDGTVYEDDAAQSVINTMFGNAFDVTSYLSQNAVNAFVLMSPTEKLSFLERFAFSDIDLSKLKAKCQSTIKDRHDELLHITSQLEMASDHFATLVEPKYLEFPIPEKKDKNEKSKEIALQNATTKLKNTKVLLKKNERKLATKKEQFSDFRVLTSETVLFKKRNEELALQLLDLQQKREEYPQISEEEISKLEEDLKLVLTKKELILAKERYEQDTERYNTAKDEEIEEMKNQISKIEENLWKEYTPEETNEMIDTYEEMYKDRETIDRLSNTLVKYKVDENKLRLNEVELENGKKRETELKQKKSMLELQEKICVCPCCNATLKIEEKNGNIALIKSGIEKLDRNEIRKVIKELDSLSETIQKLERSIPEDSAKLRRTKEIEQELKKIKSSYEEEIPELSEIQETLSNMKDYKTTQKTLEKELSKKKSDLVRNVFSSSLQKLEKQLEKNKNEIVTLEARMKKIPNHLDEETLRTHIQTMKRNREKILDLEKQISLLSKEQSSNRMKIKTKEEEYQTKYKDSDSSIDSFGIDLETEISTLEKERKSLLKELAEYEKLNEKIEIYKKYVSEKTVYEDWQTKIERLKVLEVKARDRYSATTLYKEKILEAESIAITNVIESINVHAQEYLDVFFPDNPIIVQLLPFKQTKKNTTKPQINIEIQYKGCESDLTMLSGGELSRVVLAYTLSLAEIFNSPMLLLDECTASLDQELTSIVMDCIKKNFGEKNVLAIAHQVVSGDFDHQIVCEK